MAFVRSVNVVVLPVGVPHRQGNGASEPEPVAILVPEPRFEHSHDSLWDVGVSCKKLGGVG